ncbi:MAG: YIP1 family protein [Verrucomicrobia bacterium]|nr:YIP1 family protein [Verrucomicrobiota bacterium]MCF7708577.1 YIP1 family protein [Verrucomicrobiota bacterium]
MEPENIQEDQHSEHSEGDSIWSRIVNIFTSPTEAFEGIRKDKPKAVNWLIPVLILAVVGAIGSIIVFSQEPIAEQVLEQQRTAIQDQVDTGKISQAQADQIMEKMGDFGLIVTKISVSIGAFIGSFATPFILGFVIWLIGAKIWKRSISFMQSVEVTGLSCMVLVLGAIATALLQIAEGSVFADLSPALFISEFEPGNLVHAALKSVNVINLWFLGVVAIGWSVISEVPRSKTVTWIIGLWLVYTCVSVGLGTLAR